MTSSNIICSFCGKGQQDALSLVNGLSVNPKGQQTAGVICDECVQLCVQVIALQNPEWLEKHRQFVMALWK
jgi:ATP-dependent protease Clp ATPase subunit